MTITLKDATITNTTAGTSPNHQAAIAIAMYLINVNATPKTTGTEADSLTKTANAITATNGGSTTTNAADSSPKCNNPGSIQTD
jgi:hypothetical protein